MFWSQPSAFLFLRFSSHSDPADHFKVWDMLDCRACNIDLTSTHSFSVKSKPRDCKRHSQSFSLCFFKLLIFDYALGHFPVIEVSCFRVSVSQPTCNQYLLIFCGIHSFYCLHSFPCTLLLIDSRVIFPHYFFLCFGLARGYFAGGGVALPFLIWRFIWKFSCFF